jgi:hypothetical protein
VIEKWRLWLVSWLYLVAFGHFLIGVAIAWFMHLPYFADYNQEVLSKFWPGSSAPVGTLDLQIWWINLFGATLQNMAILMLLLIYVANRLRLPVVWGGMIAALLLWAPQDMWISARRELWLHLWADLVALLVMVPPLIVLWCADRKKVDNRS